MRMTDEYYMKLALEQAQKAGQMDEVPVGAVVVSGSGDIIGYGHNRPISACDPTSHAEMEAIRMAARAVKNYRLPDTSLYVTLEPCIMCMAAVVHARIKRVVFGADDPKWGGAGSIIDLAAGAGLNHEVEVRPGILREEASCILKNFFKNKRSRMCQIQ